MSIASKLNLENNVWRACQYKIAVSLKFSDGVTRTLKDTQILNLYLEKDYDNDHLPIIMLDLALSKSDDDKIKGDSDAEFRIKITQYYVNTLEDKPEKKEPKLYINDTFLALRLKDTPDNTSKLDKKIREKNQMSDDDLSPDDMTTKSTHVLCRKQDLVFSKKMTNDVCVNVTMLDAVCLLLSKNGCSGNVLLSNFTNDESHAELLIKPKRLLEQLIYLESEYGWHTEGTYLFLDLGLLYIIRKNGKCTAWRDNEPKNVCFCISEVSSGDSVAKGIIKQGDIIYYNIGTNQYETTDGSVVGDQIEGNNMLLINTSDGSSSEVESGIKSFDGGTYATKSYHGHNPYVKEQFKRHKRENSRMLKLTCINGDLNYITPNKQYTFLTDMTELSSTFKGDYRLSSIKTTFSKNGSYFDSNSLILVKRL